MAQRLFDCPWCGSAKSIEHGLCQICMMEYPVETKIIELEPRRIGLTTRTSPAVQRPPGAAGAE